MKPRSERKHLVGDIIERLRPKLMAVPRVRVFLQNPPLLRIGVQVTKSLYQFTLQDERMYVVNAQCFTTGSANEAATLGSLQPLICRVA